MKSFYAFFSVIFLLPFFSLAQANYKPGLIITKNGQTVQGFINYREWFANPGSISFKNNTDHIQNYTPSDINYFEITGLDTYQSATVSISKARNDIQNMSDNIDTSTYTATVFLRLLQKGDNVSFFAYTDDIKTRYFIAENKLSAPPQELKYQAYFDHDSQSIKKKNTYYAQLIDLARKYRGNDADALINNIVTLDYNESKLLKIVNRINNQNPDEAAKPANTMPAYHLFAGVGINVTKISSNMSSLGIIDASKRFTLPEFTFGVLTPFNPNTGKLIFRTELSLLLSKAELAQYDPSDSFTRITGLSFNMLTASLRTQVTYNFYNTDAFKFYAGGGLAINLSRYTNVVYTEGMTSTKVPQYNTLEKTDVPASNSAWFMPMFRTGFVLNNKVDFSLAYHVRIKSIYAANTKYVDIALAEAGVNYIF